MSKHMTLALGDRQSFEADEKQVDIWYTDALRFGTVWLCRTGSKEYNIWLANAALKGIRIMDLRYMDGFGRRQRMKFTAP